MDLNKNIFRNYDIRGVYPADLDENAAFHIGKALGSLNIQRGGKNVVVGRDNRKSSPVLSAKLIEGLRSTGSDVTDIGITLTPIVHFATCTHDFDMGINVSASHNPRDFNGFRLDYKNAVSIYGEDIQKLYKMIQNENYEKGNGAYFKKDINSEYIEFINGHFKFSKKHKILIDCGNGAESEIAPALFNKLNLESYYINCKFDYNFPKGVPDPENIKFQNEIKKGVLENKADAGFGYDTDGDRFGVVDEKGNSYHTDQLLILFAWDVLKRNPGSTIAFDVKSSLLVETQVEKFGGKTKLIRTGHPYLSAEVQGESLIGAEFAGHIYFSDRYFGYDDGIYASLRLLEILERTNKPLSELMSQLPKRFSTSEIKVECADDFKFEIVEQLKEFIKGNIDYKKMLTVDGVRVHVTNSGWFLIRASNTSPYLSIRAEGNSKTELDQMVSLIKKSLKSIKKHNLNTNFP